MTIVRKSISWMLAGVLSFGIGITLAGANLFTASNGLEQAFAADAVNLTNAVDKTYSFTKDDAVVSWRIDKAGLANVDVEVSGVNRIIVQSIAGTSDIQSTYQGPSRGASVADLGSRGVQTGYIYLKKVGADLGQGAKVVVHIKSSFTEATTSTRSLKVGESVAFVQAANKMYWPLKLKKAAKVYLKSSSSLGTAMCNAKKKALDYKLKNHDYYWILPKGDYLVRTSVPSSAKAYKFDFKLTTKNLGTYTAAKNLTKKKAKSIKTGKRVTGFFASPVETKNTKSPVHYYKIKLTKRSSFSISYSNAKGVVTSFTIMNSKGKKLFDSYEFDSKGSAVLYAKSGKAYKKVELEKGAYYIKVDSGGSEDLGMYSFKVK